MLLAVPFFDPGHRFSFLRGKFNRQDSFLKDRPEKDQFISRLNANLARWDKLDGHVDWPLVDGEHPLSETMYRDYLVMDLSKPFQPKGYDEIESAVRADRPHSTSGGRWLNEDVVDYLLTLYISAGRAVYSDHVDAPKKLATQHFPFLQAPATE
jgi:hypothetical protein